MKQPEGYIIYTQQLLTEEEIRKLSIQKIQLWIEEIRELSIQKIQLWIEEIRELSIQKIQL